MEFNVRIFRYRGMRQIPLLLAKDFNSDSVFVLDEPYIGSEVISVSGVAASSTPVANDGSTILRIEVPDGAQIRYEINPNGPNAANARLAGNGSPGLSGSDQFAWGPGYSLSVVDKASFP